MTVKKIATFILCILAGSLLALLFNFFILEKILIPDPCYFHSNDTNLVFDLFYELSSSDGYHPFPTLFNFIFTISIGGLLGWQFARKKFKLG